MSGGGNKNKRINTSFVLWKDWILLSIALMIVNGCFVMIYFSLRKDGITSALLIAPSMIGYFLFISLVLSVVTGILRHYSFSRPMRRLSDAARKIAQGDFSVRLAPLRKDGKKDYVEVMFEDFNTMAEELSSIETLKDDFIANVSHELKTPLAVIQSYARAIQQDKLSDEQRNKYADTIMNASQNLSELITNILKLNKLENQEILPLSAPYDLSEQLRRCALAYENLWESKDITFQADLEAIVVSYDESILEVIWNNLLSNAIKFTAPGGKISLKLTTIAGYAVVRVTDSGCGMDEETLKHIFDKFYQGDTSHSQQGNGLGLALVMKALQMLGGKISVDSKPGTGTTFSVRLNVR
ncbi:histidine kinase [Paenibacillus sp. IHB B 3415]|uniref:HAMP domain-containing sensor histidine kinase n=1 Tax=Paenibacillus sp. IHB B 3415 TaxID=867080 RepID=UPI000575D83B|nr:HAMP domain-containing sensor histidine kinase [Paenibacillus sp. IHB B 3415]KHL97630.1 histidine kinase [Paenibacillus sp. IHB B 3415]